MGNFIYILFFSELLLIAISYTFSRGNLLSPSFVSYVMFAISTICVIYNVDLWDVHYSGIAYLFTMSGLISMLLPELLILKIVGHKKTVVLQDAFINVKPYNIKTALLIIVACLSIGMTVLYAYYVLNNGASIGGVGLNAIGYLKHEGESNAISKISYRLSMILFYGYTYIVFFNVIKAKCKLKTQLLNMVPIVCFFIVTFFNGNRMGFLKCLSAFYVIALAFTYQTCVFAKKDIRKIIKYVVLGGIILVVSFYLMRVIMKVNTTTSDRSFIDYITYYIGSPVLLFSKYLDDPYSVHSINTLFGETTLTSLWQELGFNPVYENKMLYVGGNSMFAGNAMTFFQQAHNDYGLFGMCLFTFIVYMFFDIAVYKWVLKRNKIGGIVTLMFFYYVVVTSFYYSQTMWAISLMNILYIICILILIRYLRRIKI